MSTPMDTSEDHPDPPSTEPAPPPPSKLTRESISRLPVAPSNLEMYLQRESNSEPLLLEFQGRGESMKDWLAKWNECWEAARSM
ncbi:hypothetical protein NA56DRAFT_696859 [Hyaloscypha hepaticicola]|uniref:Uncharacterized protein n=1 Tax=Hyaloscypha hepaticicola TaxID=2082293 RepID=A0A2J6QNK3_9HELO|nr:hypothetical protein NA56DRAFT_696859 [Hyaloscypha hepaticicola]